MISRATFRRIIVHTNDPDFLRSKDQEFYHQNKRYRVSYLKISELDANEFNRNESTNGKQELIM